MAAAAKLFIGEHDFIAFANRPNGIKNAYDLMGKGR